MSGVVRINAMAAVSCIGTHISHISQYIRGFVRWQFRIIFICSHQQLIYIFIASANSDMHLRHQKQEKDRAADEDAAESESEYEYEYESQSKDHYDDDDGEDGDGMVWDGMMTISAYRFPIKILST